MKTPNGRARPRGREAAIFDLDYIFGAFRLYWWHCHDLEKAGKISLLFAHLTSPERLRDRMETQILPRENC